MPNFIDIIQHNQDLTKVIAALVVGSIIGLEREYRTKSAGFRTFTLICLGSTIFTILSTKFGVNTSPDRIAANVVTGIGFLGAGVIFKTDDRVSGLTTATIIWVTASLGMSIGGGHILLSFLGAFTVVGVLVVFLYIEKWMNRRFHSLKIKITYARQDDQSKWFENTAKKHKLRFSKGRVYIDNQCITCNYVLRGSAIKQQDFIKVLIKTPDLIRIETH
jgi:putative Mg2+ transporter-C (MgtC) family protein